MVVVVFVQDGVYGGVFDVVVVGVYVFFFEGCWFVWEVGDVVVLSLKFGDCVFELWDGC